MKKSVLVIASAMVLLSGCASVSMQPATLINAPKENTALVNFVRPAIFLGDALDMDVWDGQNYIGSLAAGSMIQYEVQPGKHLFMANAENWSYASAELKGGKSYVIKANAFPGIATGRVALGTVKPDDVRMQKLMSLKPTVAAEKDRQTFSTQKSEKTRVAIANFESGKVSSFATVKPEDGQ